MTCAQRDHSVPCPVAACVMSPWTDLALTGDSIESSAKHDPMLTRAALEIAGQLYLGQVNAKEPSVPPLYGDLAGLPPVLLHVFPANLALLHAAREVLDIAGEFLQRNLAR